MLRKQSSSGLFFLATFSTLFLGSEHALLASYIPPSISGTVFLDSKKQGVPFAGERMVENAVVTLYVHNPSTGDSVVGTTTTNTAGVFTFGSSFNIAANNTDYYLKVATNQYPTNTTIVSPGSPLWATPEMTYAGKSYSPGLILNSTGGTETSTQLAAAGVSSNWAGVMDSTGETIGTSSGYIVMPPESDFGNTTYTATNFNFGLFDSLNPSPGPGQPVILASTPSAAPEPATLSLLLVGGLSFAGRMWLRRRRCRA